MPTPDRCYWHNIKKPIELRKRQEDL